MGAAAEPRRLSVAAEPPSLTNTRAVGPHQRPQSSTDKLAVVSRAPILVLPVSRPSLETHLCQSGPVLGLLSLVF